MPSGWARGRRCSDPCRPDGTRGRPHAAKSRSILEGAVVIDLTIEPDVFVDQLSQEIVTGGLTLVDAIERLLSEQIETSIRQSLGDRLVKAPCSIVYPGYYLNRFENLTTLAREGYSTWYPEVRFATRKGDSLKITDVDAGGFDLRHIVYGGGVKRRYMYKKKKKTLKTQINHVIRLNRVLIPSRLFRQVIRSMKLVVISQ